MDFTFNPQQLAFRDAVRRFLVVEAAPEMLREIWETESGRSAELRAKLADQGLTALSVPEDFGGIGQNELDWVLVLQELGYHGIPDSLVDTALLAAGLIDALPADARLKREWLPKIADGRARVALGHPLNPFVADAGSADLLLLWHDDAVHALVPEQVTLRPQPSIDFSRRLFVVDWEPAAASRIADARVGAGLWRDVCDRAALAVAAQLLGLANRMLDLGVDHAAQRKQFGKPVGSFQAVKHLLADVAVAVEFAEPAVHRAAWSLANRQTRRGEFLAQARILASEAVQQAARASMQVHGAMGYTWEADLQMFAKRAWALDAAWGDVPHFKQRLAEALFTEGALLGPAATFADGVPRLRAVSSEARS